MTPYVEPEGLEAPPGDSPGSSGHPSWSAGRAQGVATALAPIPDLSGDQVELAYLDFCTRRAAGESLDPDVYCAQFPQFQSSLARQIHAQLYCEENFADHIEPTWPETGETFLDYQLVLELGRGAFARVYLAIEPKLGNRLVAVKISPYGAGEAEILGRIQHPNIVPVYSVQQDSGGLTGVVMPYAGSATLCDLLDHAHIASRPEATAHVVLDVAAKLKYPLDPSARRAGPDATLQRGNYLDGVRFLGAKLADALAYLHHLGICHRDLKPSNVLLSPEGEPMLLDFNLCADAQETLKRLGGTMPYMSPEQLRATDGSASDAAALDARSDIFALGVILYQLATGKHPFGPLALKMTTPELRRHLVEAHRRGATPAQQLNPNVDARLSGLIQRCLAADPKDRPQSAAEIARTLRSELTPVGRVKRWFARNPGKVLTAALVLATVLFAGYILAATRAPLSERKAESGARLYQERRFNEAVELFNDALQADPRNVAALFGRGRALQQMGQYHLALRDFQEADKMAGEHVNGGRDARALACAGYCLHRLGHPQEAAHWYRLALQAGFESAELHNNLGSCLTSTSKPDDATASLDRAIALNPRLQVAYHSRVVWVLRKLKSGPKDKNDPLFQMLKAGIADVEKAVAIGPPSAELSLDAARLCAATARLDDDFVDPVVRHATDFVNQGGDPRQLGDPIFIRVRGVNAFQKLRERPVPPAVPVPTRRLVDPVPDAAS